MKISKSLLRRIIKEEISKKLGNLSEGVTERPMPSWQRARLDLDAVERDGWQEVEATSGDEQGSGVTGIVFGDTEEASMNGKQPGGGYTRNSGKTIYFDSDAEIYWRPTG